jgi:hypothetical protein
LRQILSDITGATYELEWAVRPKYRSV